MLKDWNFWCSILTAFTAVRALVLSCLQISLSNKQHLFDRRLKAYMLTNGLISLCKENYIWLSAKRKNTPVFSNDYIFVWLTNNAYMENQAEAIKHPLEQPFHKEFLRKREEIRNTAMEIELIFKGKAALAYSNFLRAYESSLARMYQYQIIIDEMKKETNKRPMTIEEAEKMFSEKEYRDNLYDAMEKLRKAYDAVAQDNIEKRMKKQLKLITNIKR